MSGRFPWLALATALFAVTRHTDSHAGGRAEVVEAIDSEQTRVITGTVKSARADGSIVRLIFAEDPEGVQVVLVIGWLSNFPPDPAAYYVGKSVSVRGRVSHFQGVAEMRIRDADDITVIEPGAASAATDRTAAGAADALEERVRRLEMRLDRLEQRLAQ